MKALLIVSSYHHGNTLKVARAMAEALKAQIVSPEQVRSDSLQEYELIGFGSGIYSAKHHPKLMNLAEALPASSGGKVFLFSTDGMPRFAVKDQAYLRRKLLADHAALRQRLEAKGYTVAGDFGCAGFNTNSFLKFFGGFNRGRPDDGDLQKARTFAAGLAE